MAECISCKKEGAEMQCAECGNPVHLKCTKQLQGKRYCKKCSKKVRKLVSLQRGY